jgi:hypothetical protein
MTHILQQLAGLGVIEGYHQEEVNELARLAEVSLPYGRQQHPSSAATLRPHPRSAGLGGYMPS